MLQAVKFLGSLEHGASSPRGCSPEPRRVKLEAMADGLVLTAESPSGCARLGATRVADVHRRVREYVGYEEWTAKASCGGGRAGVVSIWRSVTTECTREL